MHLTCLFRKRYCVWSDTMSMWKYQSNFARTRNHYQLPGVFHMIETISLLLWTSIVSDQTCWTIKTEPVHDKTNKMSCAPSDGSDPPGYPLSLIRVFAVRTKTPGFLSCPLSLLGSWPVLSAHCFASNWKLLFLNHQKRENGRRNVFMTKSTRKNVPDVGIELGAACMPSEHASDRATILVLTDR